MATSNHTGGLPRTEVIDRFEAIHDRLRNAHSILYLVSDHHRELPEPVINAATQAENFVSDALERAIELHQALVPPIARPEPDRLEETFLQRVVCANVHDRHHAMLIRKDEGTSTAVRFLEGCDAEEPDQTDEYDSPSIDELRARVSALGHRLVTCGGWTATDEAYTGLNILDPVTDRLVIISTGLGPDGDAYEIAGWCAKREAAQGAESSELVEYDPAESKLRDRAAAVGLELMTTDLQEQDPHRYALADGARLMHSKLTAEGVAEVLAEEEALRDDPNSDTNLNAEIAEAYPDASPLERKLLRAIRPVISMAAAEESQLLEALVREITAEREHLS